MNNEGRWGPHWPRSADVWVALGWAGVVGGFFFALYPVFNALTAARGPVWALYAPWELMIPLVPQALWAYLSLYGLFVLPPCFLPVERLAVLAQQMIIGLLLAACVFLWRPAQLGFVRVLPEDPLYHTLFEWLFWLDGPHNLVPSLHVVFAGLVALACADFARPWARWSLRVWFGVISASTLLVHQHHMVDVGLGMVLVGGLRRGVQGKGCGPGPGGAGRVPSHSRG